MQSRASGVIQGHDTEQEDSSYLGVTEDTKGRSCLTTSPTQNWITRRRPEAGQARQG